MFEFGRNDLQPVAQSLCPDIRQALDWMSAQGLSGRMTGSGSAVFAPIPPGMNVDPSPTGLPDGWLVKACSNLESHPLAGW